jgi:purine-binding chemotaxis protein CheW
MAIHSYCCFAVENEWFAINTDCVREVLRTPDLTPIPLAPDTLAGLMNLRGHVVLASDFRVRLGLPHRERPGAQCIILRKNDEEFSLLVDEIGNVVEMDEAEFKEPPGTLSATTRDLLRGAHVSKDRLYMVLDTAKVVSFHP